MPYSPELRPFAAHVASNGNDIDNDACSNKCVPASCGDMIVQMGEQCDDGNKFDDDACTTLCNDAQCGDGFIHAGVEQCDDAGESMACDSDCTPALCGDNLLNVKAGESCDTGGFSKTCDNDCTPPVCGDKLVNPLAGETCDEGSETASCDDDCTAVVCGDGALNEVAGELCDTEGDSNICDGDCTFPKCGDGYINPKAGENCEDANMDPGDGCSNTCKFECGNDCWGAQGCMTQGGRCIRFTCTSGQQSKDVCNTCMGWKPITYQQWMNSGYCADVTQRYRTSYGNTTRCGQAATCCADPNACAGGDNAWHFHDGANNRYVGPCLGCANDMNCSY